MPIFRTMQIRWNFQRILIGLTLLVLLRGTVKVEGKMCKEGESWSAAVRKCINCDLCDEFPGDLACENCTGGDVAENKLYKKIFHNYNKKVRPVWNASRAIHVNLSMSITQIMDLDERNQALTTNVWLGQSWEDEKLTWNPHEYGNIDILRVPASDIWFPDITLYNTADENGWSLKLDSNALVYSSGTVFFWSRPTLLKSTCKIKVRYFPFDFQSCRMKFGSWTYTSFQLNLQNDSVSPDMSAFIPNEQWEIVYAVTRPHIVSYNCCPESYPDVTFVIGLKRKPLYYVYNVVLPCVLLTALSLVGFMMPFNIGVVKVSLGVMLLLSLGVFNLQVSQTMPKTSEEISLLGEYFAATMVLISLSVAFNVAVLNLNEWGKNGTYEVPRWLRILVLRYMANLLCINQCYVVNKVDVENDDYKNNRHRQMFEMPLHMTEKKRANKMAETELMSPRAENGSPGMPHCKTFYVQPETPPESGFLTHDIDGEHSGFGEVWQPRDGPQDDFYKNKKNIVVHHDGLQGLENSCRNSFFSRTISLTDVPPAPPPLSTFNPQIATTPRCSPKRRKTDVNVQEKLIKYKPLPPPPPGLEQSVEDIKDLLRKPQETRERNFKIQYDWMIVATTVDRFLLSVFILCSVVFSVTFLVRRPGSYAAEDEEVYIDYE